MPLYNFEFDNSNNPQKMTDMRFDPRNRNGKEERPQIDPLPPGDGKPRDDIWFERQNVNVAEEVHEILPQGFRTMDRGIKNYFSGILVPTTNGVRIMQVRISGGDKPYLVWAQDLEKGRVTLPVMAIKRESEEPYLPKYSPAHYHHMTRRFLDADGTRMALVYRPVSALISYSLSVWAEHKRDLEYINYQIRTRFNPVAEFIVEDEHIKGGVFMKYNGMTAAVDDDVPAEQRANKRYDYSISMEGWLPLPEKIVPSILGRVFSLREGTGIALETGEVLDTVAGKQDLSSIQVRK